MSPATIAALASLLTAAAVFLTAWRTGRNVEVAADKLAVKTDQVADRLATKNAEIAEQHDEKLSQITVLVNGRLDQALKRIDELEGKLGLAAGAPIPSSQILTDTTEGPTIVTAPVDPETPKK